MTDMSSRRSAFSFERVIRKTFKQFGTPVGRAALVFTLVAYFLTTAFNALMPKENLSAAYLVVLVVTLVGAIFWIIFSAAITRALVHDLTDQPVSWSEEISTAIRKFWPLVGLSTLQLLGLMIGFILLIVPGIILAIIWVVIQPVMLMENRGIFETFQRSRSLTKGYRWQILGLAVIFLIGVMVPGGIGGVVAYVFKSSGAAVIGAFITSLVQGVAAFVGSAFIAALYVELREAKDGFHDQTADLFS